MRLARSEIGRETDVTNGIKRETKITEIIKLIEFKVSVIHG